MLTTVKGSPRPNSTDHGAKPMVSGTRMTNFCVTSQPTWLIASRNPYPRNRKSRADLLQVVSEPWLRWSNACLTTLPEVVAVCVTTSSSSASSSFTWTSVAWSVLRSSSAFGELARAAPIISQPLVRTPITLEIQNTRALSQKTTHQCLFEFPFTLTFRAGYRERVTAVTTVHSHLYEIHSL